MTFLQIIGGMLVLGIVAAAIIGVLWVLIRFSFISPLRTRGWESRLAHPCPEEVEAAWEVRLPLGFEELYRKGGLAERFGFFLAAPGSEHARRWYVVQFIPLTVQDVDEWMEVTGVPGIPIAIDDSKGTYYLPFGPLRRGDSAPILLRAPGPSRTDIEVAPSLEDFLRFQPVEAVVEDSEEQKEQKGKRR